LNKTLELKIADLGFARRDAVSHQLAEDEEEDEEYDFDESKVRARARATRARATRG